MECIINYYKSYNEDERITASNARRIEFVITTSILDEYVKSQDRILEVGAGTGVYSFYYADKGNEVVATDLTPSNVEVINEKLAAKDKKVNIKAEVVDATDLSRYESESFDVVTCLGPIYHITEEAPRNKCIEESLRVLKKGGILAIAYINKHYILHNVMLKDTKYLNKDFIDKILETGVIREGEKECFWTDAFFTTPTDMELLLKNYDVDIVDHVGTDGMTSFFRGDVDGMNDEEYSNWLYYALCSCRDRDILGMSNHGLLVVRKL